MRQSVAGSYGALLCAADAQMGQSTRHNIDMHGLDGVKERQSREDLQTSTNQNTLKGEEDRTCAINANDSTALCSQAQADGPNATKQIPEYRLGCTVTRPPALLVLVQHPWWYVLLDVQCRLQTCTHGM